MTQTKADTTRALGGLRNVELRLRAEDQELPQVATVTRHVMDGVVAAMGMVAAAAGGIDIRFKPILVPAPAHRWAAGLYVNPARPDNYGVFLDRDLGRLRVGAELGRGCAGKAEVRFKVGMTF